MKILIVDDETLARERLIDLLNEDEPSYQCLQASNGVEALELIQTERPELVLLDIRMPVMDGLELAQHLMTLSGPVPAIVFTTAYQDHALEAFENNAIDYLVKPIRKERLMRALDKASQLGQAKLETLQHIDTESRSRQHFSASIHGKIILQPVQEVAYLKAEQKYVTAHWPGGEMLMDESLKSIEAEFSDRFVRIHRNTLVAIDAIRGLEKDDEGNSVLLLRDIEDKLPVSRRHLAGIKKLIK